MNEIQLKLYTLKNCILRGERGNVLKLVKIGSSTPPTAIISLM
jgi:hypothetical protein